MDGKGFRGVLTAVRRVTSIASVQSSSRLGSNDSLFVITPGYDEGFEMFCCYSSQKRIRTSCSTMSQILFILNHIHLDYFFSY